MPANRPPRATAQLTLSLVEDDPLRSTAIGNLSAIFTDPDPGDSLRLLRVGGLPTGPLPGRYGVLTSDAATGSVSYALDNRLAAVQALGQGVTARERFAVEVADAAGATATGWLIVSVAGANDAPVARTKGAVLAEDGAAQLALGNFLVGAKDPDRGDTITLAGVNGSTAGTLHGRYGTLTWDAATGDYAYRLDNAAASVQALGLGEVGRETFSFALADQHGAIGSAQLIIRIAGANDAPVAEGMGYIALEGGNTYAGIGLLDGAGDIDGDSLSVVSVQGAGEPGLAIGAFGRMLWSPDGSASYAADPASAAFRALRAGESADETFQVVIGDGHGGQVTRAVSFSVTGANDAAAIETPPLAAVIEDVLPVVAGRLVVRDADAGEAAFRTPAALAGTYGNFAFDAATGNWSYQLAGGPGFGQVQFLLPGEIATEQLTVTSLDGTASATVTVLVVGSNDVPVARPDSFTTLENTPLYSFAGNPDAIVANDGSGDGDTRILEGSFATEQGGTVTILYLDGTFNYVPKTDFSGTDRFTYTLLDADGSAATGVVTITVIDVANAIAPVNLAALGARGFRIIGETGGDRAGYAVTGIGDQNGDGRADLLIGAPGNDAGGGEAGAAYVVFGQAASTQVSLAAVAAGTGGWKLIGEEAGDAAGSAVGSLADLSNDGRREILVGAPLRDSAPVFQGYSTNDQPIYVTYPDSGAAYMVLGRGAGAALDLGSVTGGADGFVIRGGAGLAGGAQVGASVAGIGDMNGDGRGEVLVGGPRANTADFWHSGAGAVVYGKAGGAAVQFDVLGTSGFAAVGESPSIVDGESPTQFPYQTGASIAAAGDVNGDNRPDFIIGAPGGTFGFGTQDRSGQPSAYVVFGKATLGNVALDAVSNGTGTTPPGFKITGIAGADAAGISVAGIGDVNGDGRADLFVGAERTAGSAGAAYVVFGKATGTGVNLANVAQGQGGFRIIGENGGDLAGGSVAGIGDVNGDGRADLLIGARGNDAGGADAGALYVVFGRQNLGAINLDDVAQGVGGLKIVGAAAGDLSGFSVAAAGDVNADGIPDILLGAPQADAAGADSGAAYVIFGQASWAGSALL